ncbi:tetratricopeptide repeat protein [Streptomyces sp. NPDC057909]|uniref:tetratricopeptide repeat protein n=1 Tax=Streptomyces sp. NPDC057909 TaxID=3346277 RepID=UPI0036E4EF67
MVQSVLRSGEGATEARDIAIEQLANKVPFDPQHQVESWPLWWDLIPHVHACTRYVGAVLRDESWEHVLNQASLFLFIQGEHEQAKWLGMRGLEVAELIHGSAHPAFMGHLTHLQYVYNEMGDHESAMQIAIRSLRIAEITWGVISHEVALRLVDIADRYRDMRRGREALATARQAFRVAIEVLHPRDNRWRTFKRSLGESYCAADNPERGLPYLREVLHRTIDIDGSDHPHAATALRSLSNAYMAVGLPREALPLMEKATRIVRDTYSDDHYAVMHFGMSLSRIYRLVGEYEKSTDLLLELMELSQFQRLRRSHQNELRVKLGLTYEAEGNFGEAVNQYIAILETLDETQDEAEMYVGLMSRVALLQFRLGRHAEAIPYWESLVETLVRTAGEEDERSKWARSGLEHAQLHALRQSESERRSENPKC